MFAFRFALFKVAWRFGSNVLIQRRSLCNVTRLAKALTHNFQSTKLLLTIPNISAKSVFLPAQQLRFATNAKGKTKKKYKKYKLKTNKSAAARFTLLGSGRVVYSSPGRNHNFRKKSASRRNRLRGRKYLGEGDASSDNKRIQRLLRGQ